MKRYVVIIIFLIVLSFLFSEPVPQDTILQVATNWLALQTGQTPIANNWAAFPDSTNVLYYRVNFNPGFVIVSADNSCIPILAFCTQGNYYIDSPQPEAEEDLLSEYSLQIEDAKNNNRNNTETLPIWNAILNQTISITEEHDLGFETPQWGQSEPFNIYCPMDNHNLPILRSKVGCVATAVAQIFNYYKHWTYRLVETDRYTSSKNGFDCEIDLDSTLLNFPDFTTLNGYLDVVEYKYNHNIPLTDNDKAALSFACGILSQMAYSSISSGAGNGWLAYKKSNMYCQNAWSRSYTSEAWIDLIKNQLRLNRPLEYIG